jgi:AraC family transcriptional activator of pobA
VARYTERLGVSSDLLHDRCVRRLGRTPLKLIHERIVHKAQGLLDQTSRTVADIAAELGYENPAHFNRLFSTATGQTPGRYRNRSGATSEEQESRRSFADWP